MYEVVVVLLIVLMYAANLGGGGFCGVRDVRGMANIYLYIWALASPNTSAPSIAY